MRVGTRFHLQTERGEHIRESDGQIVASNELVQFALDGNLVADLPPRVPNTKISVFAYFVCVCLGG